MQELHGSPWHKARKSPLPQDDITSDYIATPHSFSLPSLSPCVSEHSSDDSGPYTPPQRCAQLDCSTGVQIRSTEQESYSISHRNFFSSNQQQHEKYHSSTPSPCPRHSPRPSHDLFECIEQSPHKRLSEDQARYIFGQVVEAIHYLDSHGITHRDIKDENLVIDKDLKVKSLVNHAVQH